MSIEIGFRRPTIDGVNPNENVVVNGKNYGFHAVATIQLTYDKKLNKEESSFLVDTHIDGETSDGMISTTKHDLSEIFDYFNIMDTEDGSFHSYTDFGEYFTDMERIALLFIIMQSKLVL